MNLPRRKQIIILSVAIGVVFVTTAMLWIINQYSHPIFVTSAQNNNANTQNRSGSIAHNSTPTPDTRIASKLDGTLVAPDLASRHPLGVMIENHPDARPQYGLSSASVVYEAIAEGGITRFLAIFGPNDATKVGPIRSARTYFVDWCDEFDCFYSHVGGNYDALTEKIPADKVKDLDEFRFSAGYYRDNSRNVAIEHTMFSSTEKLFDLASKQKWSTPTRDDYSIYSFIDDPKVPAAPTKTSVTIDFSSPQYKVKWDFDSASNSYKRTMAGTEHKDANAGKQITAKNVIIQNISRTATVTKINEQGWTMPTVGEGSAVIYQNGQKIVGTWKKTDKNNRTDFYDDKGNLVNLYRGATWVEEVNPGSTVSDS